MEPQDWRLPAAPPAGTYSRPIALCMFAAVRIHVTIETTSMCKEVESFNHRPARCPGPKTHSMPQNRYSKNFGAGRDWICSLYNLTDAGKCVWNLTQMSTWVYGDSELPLLKVRLAPPTKELALRRAAAYDALPAMIPTGISEVPESVFCSPAEPSLKTLYKDTIQSFQKEDPKCFSPLMLEHSEVVTKLGVSHRQCTACDKNMQEGHWKSEPHLKRMRWSAPDLAAHVWNSDVSKWEDVNATSQSSASTTPRRSSANAW